MGRGYSHIVGAKTFRSFLTRPPERGSVADETGGVLNTLDLLYTRSARSVSVLRVEPCNGRRSPLSFYLPLFLTRFLRDVRESKASVRFRLQSRERAISSSKTSTRTRCKTLALPPRPYRLSSICGGAKIDGRKIFKTYRAPRAKNKIYQGMLFGLLY